MGSGVLSMNKLNDGGPAFPNMDRDQGLCCLGMSLRDYFAGKALLALASSERGSVNHIFIADYAYRMADCMIKARDGVKDGG